ncbi:hypothetical protein ACFL4N_03425 [Thermodesulfobacteriota bacterium]
MSISITGWKQKKIFYLGEGIASVAGIFSHRDRRVHRVPGWLYVSKQPATGLPENQRYERLAENLQI